MTDVTRDDDRARGQRRVTDGHDEFVTYPCPVCQGRGWVADRDQPNRKCPRCQGGGACCDQVRKPRS